MIIADTDVAGGEITVDGIMGWDMATGVPTRGTLLDLGIAWASDELPTSA